jgi:trigger factor
MHDSNNRSLLKIVNVSVENLAPCKKLLRVELDAKSVDETFETITKSFQKEAALPGFRPGKAPRDMVVRKYGAEIRDEAKRKLIGDRYRQALDEQKIHAIGTPDIEEIQFERGQNLIFAATVETAPDFQLPEYKGLPATLETKSVTDADVTKAVDLLRGQQAKFETVARELRSGDVAVVNYTGTSEGQPLTSLAPTAKGLTEQKGFWIEMKAGTFIPGFSEQLAGAKAGEQRTVNVDFPADFVSKDLQGKHAVYQVEVVEVKEKILPELNDELAKKYGADNVEKLTVGVRADLENELKYARSKSVRQQVVNHLLNQLNFELPESAVAAETRSLVYDLVRQNTQRGVAREMIEQQKDEIYAAAAGNAKERVRLAFIVQRIAEQEKVQVTQEDAMRRAQALAMMNQIPLEQFIKDLKARNGVNELFEQVLHEKVLELLEKNAKVTEVAVAS